MLQAPEEHKITTTTPGKPLKKMDSNIPPYFQKDRLEFLRDECIVSVKVAGQKYLNYIEITKNTGEVFTSG